MTKPSYKQWIAACTLTSTLLLGACGPAPVTRDASIVPLPNQIQQSGNAFVLTPNTTIGTTDPELQPAAQYLKEILSAATGYDLQVKEGKGTITLAKANIEGKEGETLELNDSVFGVEINEHLMHLAVVGQLANSRQGTQSAKTRSEVSGGGRKPWRQKGTGHARQGSTRSPQWTGGGVVFAPKPRDYSVKMNKKEKQLAMKSALSAKLAEDKLVVVDKIELEEVKTSVFAKILANLKAPKSLVVTKDKNDKVVLSANNIPTVKTTATNSLSVYDILKYDKLVLTKDAVAAIEEVYA